MITITREQATRIVATLTGRTTDEARSLVNRNADNADMDNLTVEFMETMFDITYAPQVESWVQQTAD